MASIPGGYGGGIASAADGNSSPPNLLFDGGHERDATWWAGATSAGTSELTTEQAYLGTQSWKITVATVLTNTVQLFVAVVSTPTTAAHWRAI